MPRKGGFLYKPLIIVKYSMFVYIPKLKSATFRQAQDKLPHNRDDNPDSYRESVATKMLYILQIIQ